MVPDQNPIHQIPSSDLRADHPLCRRYLQIGEDTASIGDLNQDGCDDFIVGARGRLLCPTPRRICTDCMGWGGLSCPSEPSETALDWVKDAGFGRSLSGGVDMDQDGCGFIGAVDYREQPRQRRMAY